MQIAELFHKDTFRGKTVFVTGGGSGINFGIARNFASLGANIAIASRSQERLDRAAAELRTVGGKVCAVAADVRNFAAVEAALARSRDELGPADVVIAGAAGNFLCEAEKLSANGFKTVIDIDLLGTFNLLRAAFEQLKQTRGCALAISGGIAWMPYVMQVHPGAAKAGIDSVIQTLALEWGRYGIRCNSIAPGYIADTEGVSRLAGGPVMDAVHESTPLGRLGTVDEIAHMAVFLASPLAAFVTGAVIPVDGGIYLNGSGQINAAQYRAAEGANR